MAKYYPVINSMKSHAGLNASHMAVNVTIALHELIYRRKGNGIHNVLHVKRIIYIEWSRKRCGVVGVKLLEKMGSIEQDLMQIKYYHLNISQLIGRFV